MPAPISVETIIDDIMGMNDNISTDGVIVCDAIAMVGLSKVTVSEATE